VRPPRKLKDGREAFRVKWRNELGVQEELTKYSLEEANQLASDIIAGRRNPDLVPDITVGEFFARPEVWAEIKRSRRLGPNTIPHYKRMWRLHLSCREFGISGLELKKFSRRAPISKWLIDMEAAGVGEPQQARVLGFLGAILDEAVEEGICEQNPIPGMKGKPSAERQRDLWIPTVEVIELLRWEVAAHPNKLRREWLNQRDALMVSLLAYEAPRPEELRQLAWDDILWPSDQVYFFAQKARRGKASVTKRYPPLNAVVREELEAWFEALGEPSGETPVLPQADWGKRKGGGPMDGEAWKDWRNRVFKPAARRVAKKVGRNEEERERIEALRPYDLRHTAISHWLASGGKGKDGEFDGSPANVVEVASWAGHQPRTLWDVYAHEVETLPKVPLADQVRPARAKVARENEREYTRTR
jgi:integrase